MSATHSTSDNGATVWKIAVVVLIVAAIGLVGYLIFDNQQDNAQDLSQAIAIVQTEMKDLGYYSGPTDGVYGPATEEAIRKVQAECGITQDGVYGSQTHACLIDLGGDA